MTTAEELADVLLSIRSELAGLNVSTDDGAVVRRIGSLIVEGRELIAQLEADMQAALECRCQGANHGA